MGCTTSRAANVDRRNNATTGTGPPASNNQEINNMSFNLDISNRGTRINGNQESVPPIVENRMSNSFRTNIYRDLGRRMEVDETRPAQTFSRRGMHSRYGRRLSRHGFNENQDSTPWLISTGSRNGNEESLDTGENLDQLRSDLVTLERLFQTLLGQQLNTIEGEGQIVTSPSSTCPPASEYTIEHLPTIKVTEKDFEDDCNKECSICFLEHNVNDTVTRLPCGHFYHRECINEWLRKRCTCPICRWELETEDRFFEIERLERMKKRRIRVKDHELDRLSIEGLQEIAGTKNIKNRSKLIKTIKNLDNVDIITKSKKPQSGCKSKVKGEEEEKVEICKVTQKM
jgi:hypothetical protein